MGETTKNPLSTKQIQRLSDAVRASRGKTADFRTARNDVLKHYAGENAVFNMMELAVTIYTTNLIVNNPRATCVTPLLEAKADAADLEVAINTLIDDIGLGETLQLVVRDSLFGIGACYIGIAEDDTDTIFGGTVSGKPFCHRIDTDDFIWDANATNWKDCQFMGHQYLCNLEELKESGEYDNEMLEKMDKDEESDVDETGVERAETMTGRGGSLNSSDFEQMVRLCDIYLPRHKVILTFPSTMTSAWTKPLRVTKYEGPPGGPYHVLMYHTLPNNLEPMAPAQMWKELNEVANALFNKTFRQALRQKTVFGVNEGGEEDAQRLLEAQDGEMLKLANPDLIKTISYPGLDQGTVGAATISKDLFFLITGNLDVLGGLSASAPTATQDQMIAQSASKRLRFMQTAVIGHVRRVVRHLAAMLYADDVSEFNLSKTIEGIDIPFRYGPDRRANPISDYKIDVDAHSLVEKTPQEKNQFLMGLFSGVIAPSLPMVMQHGGMFDIKQFLSVIAKNENMEAELADIVKWTGGQQQQQQGDDGQGPASERYRPRMPAKTERTYNRVNRQGNTRSGKDNALARTMFGENLQPKEAASLVRDIG